MGLTDDKREREREREKKKREKMPSESGKTSALKQQKIPLKKKCRQTIK
jgi:hypothetical protein